MGNAATFRIHAMHINRISNLSPGYSEQWKAILACNLPRYQHPLQQYLKDRTYKIFLKMVPLFARSIDLQSESAVHTSD